MSTVAPPDMVIHTDETGFYVGDRKVIAKFLGMNPASLSLENLFGLYIPDGSVTLIVLPNVRFLWRSLQRIRQQQNAKAARGDQTVHLFMPCGFGRRFIAFDDLPWTDAPCPCGNPQHYLVRYSDPMIW